MKQRFVKRNALFETKPPAPSIVVISRSLMKEDPVRRVRATAPRGASRGAAGSAAVAPKASKETADLTLRLLEYLAEHEGQSGVTDLAHHFGTSKTTIFRHLQTLLRRNYVTQDRMTQRYEISVRLFQLGELLRDRFDILGASRGEMNRLRDECGQAVTITTLTEGKVVVLELVQGLTVIEFGVRRGTSMGLHCSAHGKVSLAFGPPNFLQACLKGPLPALSPDTVTDPVLLEKQIHQIRRQGWATAANEVVFGVNALAAPIFDHRGNFAGAIAIVGSVQYIGAKPKPEHLSLVQTAAQRISQTLGYRGQQS